MKVHTMSKVRTFPIVLKQIIQDAAKDTPTFTRTDKQVRAMLRTKFADKHAKNTSWVASTAAEYDRLRSAFDPAYAAKIAKPRRTPKAKAPAADKAHAHA